METTERRGHTRKLVQQVEGPGPQTRTPETQSPRPVSLPRPRTQERPRGSPPSSSPARVPTPDHPLEEHQWART